MKQTLFAISMTIIAFKNAFLSAQADFIAPEVPVRLYLYIVTPVFNMHTPHTNKGNAGF